MGIYIVPKVVAKTLTNESKHDIINVPKLSLVKRLILRDAKCLAKQVNDFQALRLLNTKIVFSHIHIRMANNTLDRLEVYAQRLHL